MSCTGKTEEVVWWEVFICLDLFLRRLLHLGECYPCFGQEAVVAIVSASPWVNHSRSQGRSPDDFHVRSPLDCWAKPCCVAERTNSSSKVSPRVQCRHSNKQVNQENCNYGGSKRAESCTELSFSQQVGLVFSPQTTASLPLLSRPVILTVYERISISPSVSFSLSLPHTSNTAQPETFYYPYFGTSLACLSIFGLFSAFVVLPNLQ